MGVALILAAIGAVVALGFGLKGIFEILEHIESRRALYRGVLSIIEGSEGPEAWAYYIHLLHKKLSVVHPEIAESFTSSVDVVEYIITRFATTDKERLKSKFCVEAPEEVIVKLRSTLVAMKLCCIRSFIVKERGISDGHAPAGDCHGQQGAGGEFYSSTGGGHRSTRIVSEEGIK